MYEYLPLLIVGAIVGVISGIMIFAYATIKDKKESIGFDRKMKDTDLFKRLLAYAKPYWKNFVFVGVVMLVTISYDITSPLIVSSISELALFFLMAVFYQSNCPPN